MQVSQYNEKLYEGSKQEIPSIHRNNWKLFSDESHLVLLHIPSSTLLTVLPRALTGGQCKENCPLCLFEKQVQIAKKPAPVLDISAIALNVVESCNLRCTYCFAGEGDYGKPSVMSIDIAKQVIQFFTQKRNQLHIVFFGGEPLLNFNLIEQIVHWCEKQSTKSFSYAITTNGVLLKQAILEFFKKYQFEVKISYDGPLLQEKQRFGADNRPRLGAVAEKKLQKYSSALADLRSIKIRSTFAVNHLPDFFSNLIRSLNSFNYKIAYARAAVKDSGFKFTIQDAKKLNSVLEKLVDFYLKQGDFHSLLRISNLKKFIMMVHHGDYHRNFCGAGINYLSVSSSGSFYLCHRFTEDEDESLGDYENGFNLNKFNEIASIRTNKTEPCSSCWMRSLCGGGCFHEHKTASGSIAQIDPIFCMLQDAEIKQSIRIYLLLKHEAPELLD
ncbi:MAG: SPASM domain-containing protein [Oligoflexales bacterium]|nr:SPASM domain-containing protein [Oligoflexales bacterium]